MQDNYGQNYGQGNFNGMGNIPGGIAALLGSFFMKNPADAAMGYYNKMPGMYQQYYNPYVNAGMGALNNLQGQYGRLMNNPTSIMNNIGSTYHQSPAYQWQLRQNLQAANQAAAAGGMAGSPQNQQYAAQLANNMANTDYYNYVDRGMNLYDTGLQGEQGLNQMGYNASDELAQSLGNTYMNMGNLAYAGQQGQNNLLEYALGSI